MIGEEITRVIFEHIFDKPFKTVRPKWLIGLKGVPLELDGYNEELKLAFEYQGIQHYKRVPRFHKTSEEYNHRRNNDQRKREVCKEYNITLIEIPYTIDIDYIQKFIVKVLFLKKIDFNKNKRFLNTTDLELPNASKVRYKHFQELVKQKGGKLLVNAYLKADHKVDIVCKNGHIFSSTYGWIKDGSWCKECILDSQRVGISHLKEYAKKRGGDCLATEYKHNKEKLEWVCKEGHIFSMRANDVLSSHWCPICGRSKQKTIDEMQQLAEKNGGKCLSSYYRNQRTKLKWKCKNGHVFETTPANVTKGNWCNYCSKHGKTTIESVRYFAKEHNAVCLSSEYAPGQPLKWICKNGHEFEKKLEYCKIAFCVQCNKTDILTKKKDILLELKEFAKQKGGECISEQYINCRTPLEWKCKKSHIFKDKCDAVKKRKVFCKECGN